MRRSFPVSARQGALIAMVAAALVYLPVLRAEFVLDDQWVMRKQIPEYRSVLSPFDARASLGTWIYRPLGGLVNIFEEAINRRFVDPGLPHPIDKAHPARARVFHVLSLLVHILATGTVTLLAAELLKTRRAGGLGAAASGLIFALHPIHLETVAWIGARADSLVTLFFVVSLLALFQARRSGAATGYAAVAAAYLLALLSKENAAAGVLLVPFALHVHPEQRVADKPLMKPVALYGGILALYQVLRSAGGGTVGFGLPPDLGLAMAQGLAAAGFYLRKILIPWPLTPLTVALPGPAATFSFLGVALVATAAAVARFRRGERIYLFCLAWFVVTCLPMLPLAMKGYTNASVAERYLYLPSVGFALSGGAVTAAFAVSGRRLAAGSALGLLLAAYGITAWWSAATVWQNNLTLFSAMTRQREPARHPTPWIGLGAAYLDRKNPVEAEKNFLRALAADIISQPLLQAAAWSGLGGLRLAEAEKLLASGQATEAAARFRAAEQNYTRAVAGNPGETEFRASRALSRLQLLLLEHEGGTLRGEASLREAGMDIAEVARRDPKNPSLPVMRGIYRTLGGTETP